MSDEINEKTEGTELSDEQLGDAAGGDEFQSFRTPAPEGASETSDLPLKKDGEPEERSGTVDAVFDVTLSVPSG